MTIPEERWEPVEPGQLQVGDYVRIDHRWFDHPFTRRMFRIGSEKEIAIMREVELTRVFVDRNNTLAAAAAAAAAATAPAEAAPAAQTAPPVSTAPAAESPVAAEAAPGPGATAAPAAAESPAPAADPAQAAPVIAPAVPAKNTEAKLAAQREALAAAQARDRVTHERAQEMLTMLSAGDPGSAVRIAGYVDYLVAILNNSTTPMAPMAPAAQRKSMSRLALLGSDAVWLVGTVGKRMRLGRDALRALTLAAAGHAVGLTRMPPHQLDEEPGAQFIRDNTFRSYPLFSAKILKHCGGFDEDVLRIVLEHRERPDGSGFPRGLRGDAIHPHALILGAVRELQMRCAGSNASPGVVLAANFKMIKDVYGAEIANQLAASLLVFPVGTYVQLSDGSVARILRINEAARMSPVVETYGPNAALSAPETLDLSQQGRLVIVRALDTSRLPPRMFDFPRKSRAGSIPPKEGATEGAVVREDTAPPPAEEPAAAAG